MINKLGAEAFGTFWLVLGGCGSAVLAAAFPDVGIGLMGVALAFGLTVLTVAYRAGISIRLYPSDWRWPASSRGRISFHTSSHR